MIDERVLVGPPVPPAIRERTGETLLELLDRAVERDPEAPIFLMPRKLRLERWTYRDLERRSRQVEATLARHGVGPGDRVATWAANDPWLVAAYFAIWRLGASVVPLDLRMAPDVAIRIGRAVRPVLTLVGHGVSDEEATALGAPYLRIDAETLVGATAESTAPTEVTPGMLAEILFTSGTTSDPKGVMLTHGQMIHNARTIAVTAGIHRERALALIPLSHMYGQIVPLLYGLVTNSQLTFLPALTPTALIAAMRRDRVTVITAVPQLLKLLMDRIEAEAARTGRLDRLRQLRRIALHLPIPLRRLMFRSVLAGFGGQLRTITCGGASLPADLQLAWEGLGIVVIQGYGATECATIAGHTRASRRPGTVGPPLAGMEVRLGSDGELIARGPNVMSGYWNKPEQTAEVLVDGWAHSGDAAEIGPHGELIVHGRTRDRIALPNGLKVYPEDVEAAIVEDGTVRAAVVFEASPGRIAAVLLPSDAAVTDADLAATVERANHSLAPHQRVRRWVRWTEPELPTTHTLKVRRAEVVTWYAATTAAAGSATEIAGAAEIPENGRPQTGETARPEADPGDPPSSAGSPSGTAQDSRPGRALPSSPEAVVTTLVGLVADVVRASGGTPNAAIGPTTTLDELGFDSLGRVGLALQIEDVFGSSLDDSDIAGADDLAGLATIIVARRGAAPPPEPRRWAHGAPARIVRRWLDRLVTGPVVRMVGRPEVDGLENLVGLESPVLICPNHTSHLDAPSVRYVLTAAQRERTAIAAAADYFFAGGLLGPIVALATGAFPFGRTEHVRASLERVGSYLDAGWNVIVFPEGTRSTTGQLGPLKSGIGLLATQLDVPVVPVGIRGAYRILPKGARLPRRRGRVQVRFGAPLIFEPGCTVPEATSRIEAAIRDLVEP
jgi:long-chain acyl-CoA synthetase